MKRKHENMTKPQPLSAEPLGVNADVASRSGPSRSSRWLRAASAAVLALGFACRPVFGGDIPDFLRVVVAEGKPASERDVAERNVLALDTSMMAIYEDSLAKFKRNMQDRVPIILALFSEAGGKMILYRPGQEPLVAEPVPIVYQLAKSVSHNSMAVYEIVAPYLANPSDKSWHGPMRAYRTRCQTALESLDALDLATDHREVLRAILTRSIAFMDECLKTGTFTAEGLETFARESAPYFGRTIGIAAHAQVAHWMSVLERWKAMLGKDWEQTYAASNTIYVTRHNNVLFTVLAQFMGEAAIGDRLLLLETTEFTTTPEKMLDLITRIVADRSLGKVFFKDYFLMDAELLGGGARKVIAEEATKRGLKPLLPPLTPFYSNQWPWNTDPKKGKGPASLEEVK
jgi:hypothetical protein